MSSLAGRRIVLGVTGGIAAYKAVEVCRRLVDAGAHVVPILTSGGRRMVGETTFSALASEPVRTSLFDDPETPIPHTTIGQSADLILVCPATARVLSDMRTGRSADLLTATILATRAPVMVCPAMHTEMWEQPSVQENLAVLADRGVLIVAPESGQLAGGDMGHGRLPESATVLAAVEAALGGGELLGQKVLVSAGGTREPIDAVRYIANRSSGKQGNAVAAEAASRGADVVLVTTQPNSAPTGVRIIAVETAAEMAAACELEAPDSALVVMAAAVADFRPAEPADGKLKKVDGAPAVVLVPTIDILATLGAAKPAGQTLIGFAAETDDLVTNAAGKLARKNLDLIVANDVSKPNVGFGHSTNEVVLLLSDGTRHDVPLSDKREIACAVLDAALGYRS
ncbi:MAG: bifunctional phosphopantothenoylcysteine decarboxylase/phosphopantothenate--cysteine ligase CoaBC [Acidimicrobiaceae bacterium]|jgi:phosphopantothenoylcysteine decarboxylase / phosphopantothenate---cysteine ligase|nr:bifunctional phosphopantothenoylcysteine decarboxylase/phosphopantothenate--cysteine ligase CoaBC [Acidimicrobiaceae bacterium]MBT5581802.1 bifunctional phosphopantothenoylcysteine decarboxylase/phosphopantothenate--cysteine ligase CoaBC [Acidimicrobiaceae bacterium]MBT5849182.1 bifunctional phosphopantothenoylcysteine decarboxylase/phosphopantothenate--cysteine ligase CoaBC [Acidimicrobiaceae bacterium]